jgi:amino acid transporter
MNFAWDPITFLNLILSLIILFLGFWNYNKVNDLIPVFIGLAFGLFGLSHLLTLFGLKTTLEIFLIIIRTIAYLLVIFALYRLLTKK